MAFGLFGKLPQKRDFVSVNLPHSVLHPFESWLQSAVAASRNEIGRGWEEWYLVAPIWHFWIGHDVLGVTCAGALMPSVDQVGRYFPLAIMYCAEPNEDIPPPLLDPMTDWYRSIDERLLAVLAEQREFEIAAVISGLQPPYRSGNGAPSEAPSASTPPDEPAAALPPDGKKPTSPWAVDAPPPAPPGKPVSPWDVPAGADDPLAEVRKVIAADVPASPVKQEPASHWDADPVVPEAPTPPAVPAPPSSEDTSSVWGVDAAPTPPDTPVAPEAELPPAPPVVPDLPTAAPLPDLPPSAEVPAPADDTYAMDVPPPPTPPAYAPEPPRAPPRIMTSDFKGGFVSIVEPSRLFAEATYELLQMDYNHAVTARSYWWCEATQSGSAQLHARQGLPDPYFFSRMLMWSKG